jgi:hypothetical protein
MIVNILEYAAVALLMGTSLALLLSQSWRWSIVTLALQYLAVFWLVSISWPFGLAVVKLVTGWMAGALIGASQPNDELVDENFAGTPGLVFRLIVALMVWALIYTLLPTLAGWIPASQPVLFGGFCLIGSGLQQLGMTTRPLRVVLGLLTALSGFEILYAVIEQSVLVAGLTSVITLGLAMVAAYLMASPSMEDSS